MLWTLSYLYSLRCCIMNSGKKSHGRRIHWLCTDPKSTDASVIHLNIFQCVQTLCYQNHSRKAGKIQERKKGENDIYIELTARQLTLGSFFKLSVVRRLWFLSGLLYWSVIQSGLGLFTAGYLFDLFAAKRSLKDDGVIPDDLATEKPIHGVSWKTLSCRWNTTRGSDFT